MSICLNSTHFNAFAVTFSIGRAFVKKKIFISVDFYKEESYKISYSTVDYDLQQ